MEEIIVKKSDLIAKLKENLEKHDIIYNEAVESFWEIASKGLETGIKAARKQIKSRTIRNGAININIQIAEPENHRNDYEAAIDMMEMDVRNQITLTPREFDQYVRNNWQWKQSFLRTNSNYINSVAIGASASSAGSDSITMSALNTF